jgi:hypothetical protein
MAVWYSEQTLRQKHILMVQELCEKPETETQQLEQTTQ